MAKNRDSRTFVHDTKYFLAKIADEARQEDEELSNSYLNTLIEARIKIPCIHRENIM